MTRSACYFAVRVLTDPDIPPSAGAYRPIEVLRARGLPAQRPRSPAAVVGGNVETSSRVADVVLRAFGRALGQGTMNNLTLGNEDVVYYETIGGGQGACPDADGPSGVHVAMSNTLNTPVEALELEFPLRVVEYALRRGSGGAGRSPRRRRRGPRARGARAAALLADHRAPAPRAARAPPAASRARRGRNLLDGEELPAKAIGELRARAAAADRDPGRRRATAGPAGGRQRVDDHRAMSVRVAFLGLGIMGSRMAANLARAGFELTVWNRTAATAEAFAAEHGARSPRRRPQAAARADIVITMVVDGRPGRGGAARPRTARPARRAAGHAVRRLLDDRARRHARIGGDAGRARADADRRPGHRLLAAGAGRHADDHGRRLRRGLRAQPAAARGDGRADRPRRPARARARWSS